METEKRITEQVNTKLRDRYDRIASQWNEPAYEGTRRDDLIPDLITTAEMPQQGNVLEAMCGTGILSQRLKEEYPDCKYTTLDFSSGMLAQIPDSINKVHSSVIDTKLPNEEFDRVFLRSALYDLPRDQQLLALKELKRVLKKDGIFVLQTYVSSPETNDALNGLVNQKDASAGQFQATSDGDKYPRYFATEQELEDWFRKAGLKFEKVKDFDGVITYLKTKELTGTGKQKWVDFANNLPEEIKKRIKLKREEDGTISYHFPGVIYKLQS